LQIIDVDICADKTPNEDDKDTTRMNEDEANHVGISPDTTTTGFLPEGKD